MMMGPGFHASPTFLPSQANTSELGRRQFNRHLRSFPPSTCDLSARSGTNSALFPEWLRPPAFVTAGRCAPLRHSRRVGVGSDATCKGCQGRAAEVEARIDQHALQSGQRKRSMFRLVPALIALVLSASTTSPTPSEHTR